MAYQSGDYQFLSLTNNDDNDKSAYKYRKISSVLGCVVLGALFAFLAVNFSPSNTQQGSFEEFFLLEGESELPIKVAAFNRYSLRDGRIGQEYHWLDGSLFAEPYQTTHFNIISPNQKYEFESKIVNSKTGVVEAVHTGAKFDFQFQNIQDRKLEVNIFQIFKGERTKLETAIFNIIIRYVRREIRMLFEDDLEQLLDTMRVLWDVSQKDGVEMYGESYKSIIEMHKFHLKYAAAPGCDHLHDGYGFFTQHAALTIVFEQSLQSVNPSVSLPYWDYTLDIEKHFAEKGADFSNFVNSELFSSKYFGATDLDTNFIADGRWKDLQVPYIWDAGLSEEEMKEMPSNAYGQLRSPWSNNKDPRVVRSSLECGADASIAYSLPYCEVLHTLQNKETFEDYMQYISYKPHGPVHIQTGGSLGCEESYNKLLKYFDQKQLDHIKGQSFIFHEGAFRSGFLVCDTEDKKCFCPNEDNLKNSTTAMWDFLNEIGFDKCVDMTDEFNADFIEIICNSGLVEGDNAQASSSYTPEFWPIHPTVERMVQKRRIMNDFTDLDWPEGASWLPGKAHCYGHRWNDTVLMGSATFQNAKGQKMMPNNVELFEMLSPFSSDLTYIYDNLKWDYCKSVGYEI